MLATSTVSAVHRVVLDELEPTSRRIECTASEAEALAAFKLVDVEPADGAFQVRPRGRVGAVRVGDLQVEVTPKDKVGIASVFFLLGYADNPGFVVPDVVVDRDDDVFSAIAEALARQAERALAGGLHRSYVSVEESARTVRGRIRMGDQVRHHFGSMYPVEVTYDDYSPDNAENQILLTALRRVLRLPRMRGDLVPRLVALEGALVGVSEIQRGEPVPRWVPSRLNERYHGAMRLAELVLRHQSVRPGGGIGLSAAGFVVDMARVFEDFVSVALREALATLPGTVHTQYRTLMDEPNVGVPQVAMRPDVVQEYQGRAVIVADAKYKAASTSGDYPNADKYQMLAYCTALGVDRAWLVYAQGGAPVVRQVRNTDIEIVEWPLDLSLPPEALLASVGDLADAMRASAPGRELVAEGA